MRKILLLIASTAVLFSNQLQITFDKPYLYNERMKKKKITVPKNPALPVIDGFVIDRAKYKNYEKLRLMYKLPDKTRMKEQYEGRYWSVGYIRNQPIKTKDKSVKENAREDLLNSYKTALTGIGAKVYRAVSNPDDRFVFNLGEMWGVFDAYPNSCSIKIVEIEAFEQKLHIDPDEIQAELIKKGEIELEGVYFDTAKATLKPSSHAAILGAAALLKKYPTLKLEVQGHTDSVGSDASNLDLSHRRAASVKNALIDQGIDTKRLESKGYGESAPIATNDTEAGRAENRRVMLKRISGGEEKAVITIDFFKPIPGFVKHKVKESKDGRLSFRINQEGKKETKKIFGKELLAYYKLIDKKDRTVSYLEIVKNYQGVLESFGAQIKGKDFHTNDTLYFHIPDRGDGKEIYGMVNASNSGSYTIHFLIPHQQKEQS